VIRYEELTKRYRDHLAVDRLSLRIEPGEVVALLGPNGSGKTTTLKAAAGLLAPTAGRVLVGGAAPSRPDARAILSYLPQKVAFPESLTGWEVVDFYRKLRSVDSGRADEVLRFASLNGSSGRAVGTYSGGMVQRLGLAVAMLPDTPLMLLDEPTAALDPIGLTAFYEVVDAAKERRRTILFTSHQLGDVERLADRVAILVEGKLAGVFSQRELAASLGERGVMRVQTSRGEIAITGPPSNRPRALDEIRSGGVEILSLTIEECRLDTLYRELVTHD